MKFDNKRVRADHARALLHIFESYGINHNDITVVSVRPRADAAKAKAFVTASELKTSKGGLMIQWTDSAETCWWASITSASGCDLKARLATIENTKVPYPEQVKVTAPAAKPARITVSDIEPEDMLPVSFDPEIYWVGPHLLQFQEILDGATDLDDIETAVSMILDGGDYKNDADAQRKSVSHLVNKLIREGSHPQESQAQPTAPPAVFSNPAGESAIDATARVLGVLGEVETLTDGIQTRTTRLEQIGRELEGLPNLQRPQFQEDRQVINAVSKREEADASLERAQLAFDAAERALNSAKTDAATAKSNEETARGALTTKASEWKDSQSSPLREEKQTLQRLNVSDRAKLALLRAELEKPENVAALKVVELLKKATSLK